MKAIAAILSRGRNAGKTPYTASGGSGMAPPGAVIRLLAPRRKAGPDRPRQRKCNSRLENVAKLMHILLVYVRKPEHFRNAIQEKGLHAEA